MLYKDDIERAKKKYIEYWAKENHDRPIISVHAPKKNYVPSKIVRPESLSDRWLDTEYVIKRSREYFKGTYFGGEALPILYPNLGPDVFASFLGCNIQFGEDTSWAEHFVQEWDKTPEFKFNMENLWWKKIKEMTEDVAKDSKGDYIIGITDLHPGLDGLVALRGPENCCMDLFDNPEEIKKRPFELFDVFKKVTDELHGIITKYQEGSTNWMGIWHPDKWYVTSCDFMCMISQEMFKDFVLDELLKEIDYLDASIFHLDGPGALKHLDALLEIPTLDGIQWVYGAGQPTAAHWIPVLKKIQDAGKLIQVNIVPEDLDTLLENLKPEGVMYSVDCSSEEEAEELLKKAERAYKKKVF